MLEQRGPMWNVNPQPQQDALPIEQQVTPRAPTINPDFMPRPNSTSYKKREYEHFRLCSYEPFIFPVSANMSLTPYQEYNVLQQNLNGQTHPRFDPYEHCPESCV